MPTEARKGDRKLLARVGEAEAEVAETAALAEKVAEMRLSHALAAKLAAAEAEVRRRADGADAAGADDADGAAGAAGADGAATVAAGADGVAKLPSRHLQSDSCRTTPTVAKSDRDVLALVDATIAAGATVAATGAAKGESKVLSTLKDWGLSDTQVAQFVGGVTQQLRQRTHLV